MDSHQDIPYTFESLAADLDAVAALFDMVLRLYDMELSAGPCNALYGISRLLEFTLAASHQTLLQGEQPQIPSTAQA